MALVIVAFNNVPYAGWKEVEVSNKFDSVTGECTVTMSVDPVTEAFPCAMGDKAVVTIDGRPVVTGHVHTISGSDDWGSHNVTVNIRDKTQDLVDSTIGPKQESKPPVSLKKVCEDCVKKMGLDFAVKDLVGPELFRGSELIKGWIDDRGFTHLDKYARARQTVLNTDGKGNLQINRNTGKRGSGYLYRGKEDNARNNILKSSFSVSDANRHNKHSAAGQKSPNDKDHWEAKPKGDPDAQAGPVSKNIGEAEDPAVRPQRRIHYRGYVGQEGQTPRDAARWRANLARSRDVTYSATVAGYYCGGEMWWPGVIIPVSDNHWQLETEMFIKGVTLRKSWDGGETTELELSEKDAFSNKETATDKKNRTSKRGIGNK